jgi:hypothetical protein
MKMTFAEFCNKIVSILPDATVEQDLEGQIIIYTNLKEQGGKLVDFDPNDVE